MSTTTISIVNSRIVGTRITVYDVYYYQISGWSCEKIAELFQLTAEQVQAAFAYIEANKAEVHAVHEEIEERNARGNPPELQAKLDAGHARFLDMVRTLRDAKEQEGNGAGHPSRP